MPIWKQWICVFVQSDVASSRFFWAFSILINTYKLYLFVSPLASEHIYSYFNSNVCFTRNPPQTKRDPNESINFFFKFLHCSEWIIIKQIFADFILVEKANTQKWLFQINELHFKSLFANAGKYFIMSRSAASNQGKKPFVAEIQTIKFMNRSCLFCISNHEICANNIIHTHSYTYIGKLLLWRYTEKFEMMQNACEWKNGFHNKI